MEIKIEIMSKVLDTVYKNDLYEYTKARHLYVNMGYKISIISGKHVVEKSPTAEKLNPYFWRENHYMENIIAYYEFQRQNDRKSYNILTKIMKKLGYNVIYSEADRRITIEAEHI